MKIFVNKMSITILQKSNFLGLLIPLALLISYFRIIYLHMSINICNDDAISVCENFLSTLVPKTPHWSIFFIHTLYF